MTAPLLTRRDLEPVLERLYTADREHLLVAFHGAGGEERLEVRGMTVRVVPVGGELELRRRLLETGDDERVAFLVPWTKKVPIDLQGRFARRGDVLNVGPSARLARMFGAPDVDDRVHACKLVDYLLTYHASDSFAGRPGRLTVDVLWAGWLERAWGLDAGGELALDILLGWAALDGRGPQFLEQMRTRGALPVREALLEHLERTLGAAGGLAWTAWEAGRGAVTLELALVLGALGTAITDDPVVAMWARTTCVATLGTSDPDVLRRLGAAGDTALRYVERRAGTEQVRQLVAAADARASDDALAPHLVASTRLPSAWRARLDRLGQSLAAAAAAPTRAAVEQAIERLRALQGHELFTRDAQTATVRRAEMAVRLAGWLAGWSEAEPPPAVSPHGDVASMAAWYVREGGWVDWARHAARGTSDHELGRGIAALLARVDDARQSADLRFARALPAWHDARRPESEVVPIDRATRRVVAEFLAEHPERRLLVVLMDGMAWAQAAELLDSLGQRTSLWAPLAWHGMGRHRIGDAPFPPVLSGFPSLTEVSRAAFFAGASMKPGTTVNTQDDPRRWLANRDVQPFIDASGGGLMLRADGHTRDGSASPQALSQVADRTRRLVAVVINTIDMALDSDAAHDHRWTVDAVKSLRDLLDKAAESGRAVLLCSDHGHVAADRLESAGALRDGARWRAWQSPDEPLAAHEVGLRAGDGVWAPRGAHGVVMMADDAHRYGGGAGAGAHGGASLAEAIAPCVLIGNADSRAQEDDRALEVRPLRPPRWWSFDVAGDVVRAEPPERRVRKSRAGAPTEAQLSLTGLPEVPRPSELPRPAPPPSPLVGSKLLEARAPRVEERNRVIKAVEVLRARNGVADAAAFAVELGEFPVRVAGLVTRLQEVLNVDGYQVLRHDRVARQVLLDVEMLAQQFEIKL